jgi:hypothetical protein
VELALTTATDPIRRVRGRRKQAPYRPPDPEPINAGHHVIGLSRSNADAEVLTRAGVEVLRGDVNDLNRTAHRTQRRPTA